MGDTVPDHKNIKLNVLLPGQKCRDKTYSKRKSLRNFNNGIDAEFIVNKKGVYRVEVYNEDRAWIYSNHIRVEV
jgi:hypothetical protein